MTNAPTCTRWLIVTQLGVLFWLGVNPERVIDLGEEGTALPQKKVLTA